MEDLPAEMIIVGGGYIGSETAHICHAFGCAITMIVSESVPLDKFDKELAGLLMEADQARGMKFHLESRAVAVRKQGKRYEVDVEDESGKCTTLTTDRVIHCAGRVPNLEALQLDKAGIKYDKQKGISVDAYLTTNLAHVHALGDCTDRGLPLTPVASYDAKVLSRALFAREKGKSRLLSHSHRGLLPARHRLRRDDAREAEESERNITVRYKDLSDSFHARHRNAPVFAYKVLIDEAADLVVGAHLVGPGATEMINLFYLIIRQRIPIAELDELILAYPTAGLHHSDRCFGYVWHEQPRDRPSFSRAG